MLSLGTALIFVISVALAGISEAAISGVESAVTAGAKDVWSMLHAPSKALKKLKHKKVEQKDNQEDKKVQEQAK